MLAFASLALAVSALPVLAAPIPLFGNLLSKTHSEALDSTLQGGLLSGGLLGGNQYTHSGGLGNPKNLLDGVPVVSDLTGPLGGAGPGSILGRRGSKKRLDLELPILTSSKGHGDSLGLGTDKYPHGASGLLSSGNSLLGDLLGGGNGLLGSRGLLSGNDGLLSDNGGLLSGNQNGLLGIGDPEGLLNTGLLASSSDGVLGIAGPDGLLKTGLLANKQGHHGAHVAHSPYHWTSPAGWTRPSKYETGFYHPETGAWICDEPSIVAFLSLNDFSHVDGVSGTSLLVLADIVHPSRADDFARRGQFGFFDDSDVFISSKAEVIALLGSCSYYPGGQFPDGRVY